MASSYALTARDIVGLMVLVGVFVVGPLVFALCCGRTSKQSLPECPHCGAQNRGTPTRCYCCGHVFTLPESHDVPATVIQMVRQADAERAKQPMAVHSPPVSKVA